MGENVKHFSLEEKNDNTYGWPWNEVVKTFLQSHYNDEEKQCSIKIRNKEYKILKRESVTVFYDADGNTLFDVTNDRLEKGVRIRSIRCRRGIGEQCTCRTYGENNGRNRAGSIRSSYIRRRKKYKR